jgi:hypothetical protein
MSYNVAICIPPVSTDERTAWEALDGLINAQGPRPQVFRELHDLLTAKYPCNCTLPEDRLEEEGVWSDGLLWNDFGHCAAVLGMTWSRVQEVLPFLVRTANSLWPNCFRLGRPDYLSARADAALNLTVGCLSLSRRFADRLQLLDDAR